jgi:hypothetical protein
MAVMDRIQISREYQVLAQELERAEQNSTLQDFARALAHAAKSDAEAGKLDDVIEWSALLDRLAADLLRNESGDAREARGYLLATLDDLDRQISILSQQRDVHERDDEAAGVRERVLGLLTPDRVLRTSEIATELAIATSQVSRALRELQQRGDARRVDAPAGAHDGRAHFFAATVPAGTQQATAT